MNARPSTPDPFYSQAFGKLAKRGVGLMIGRQFGVQFFTFIGGIFLARLLTPEIFGVFGVTGFIVTMINLLGSGGLAPALIQQKKELTEHDLRVAFTCQFLGLGLIATAIWLLAPKLLTFYPTISGPEYVWLVRIMALKVFLISFRSMSLLQAERQMNYKTVAMVEFCEPLIYQLTAITLAFANFEVWSLVWATLLQTLFGASVAIFLCPWRPGFSWDPSRMKSLLEYGIPFQANQVLQNLGGWVTPLLVVPSLGPAAMGFLTWSSSIANKPSHLNQNFMRVAFPHFSRIQGDFRNLGSAFESYLLWVLGSSLAWSLFMLLFANELVPLLYGNKWNPALQALYVYAIVLTPQMMNSTMGTLLRALGHAKWTACVTLIQSAGLWVLVFVLLPHYGFLAVPMSMLCTHSLALFLLYMKIPQPARHYLPRMLPSYVLPLTVMLGLLFSEKFLNIQILPWHAEFLIWPCLMFTWAILLPKSCQKKIHHNLMSLSRQITPSLKNRLRKASSLRFHKK